MFLVIQSLWNQGVLNYTNFNSQSLGENTLGIGEVGLIAIMLTRTLNNRWLEMWCCMLKKIEKISLVLLLFNLVLLVFIPIIFVGIFNFFPNLDSTENGIGAYPLLAVILGGYSLIVTAPFAFIMLLINVVGNMIKK